MKNDEK
jgi:hypothetical protein